MLPNIERGTSFKGVTAYPMHDKREGTANDNRTAERVGFTRVLNFIGDEAREPFEASRVMALTVRDADYLKAASGIKPGGRKAEKPPVWHTSLSWHPSEQVDEREMMAAVESCLSAVGLDIGKGYQTYIVQHTDEPQPHVHIVVNLVHPINGKQANPYRDQNKAQAWGLKYEKERGKIFCKAREDRYGDRSPEQAAFNAAAQGREASPATADRFGRSRDRKPREPRKPRTGRPEWQARKNAGNDNAPEAREAAERLKADIGSRFAAIEAATNAAIARRKNETSRFYRDRKEGRGAIYEKYASALDAIWKPQPRPKMTDEQRDLGFWVARQLDARQQAYNANERHLLGRMQNAVAVLPAGASLFAVVWLTVNRAERRRLFNVQQHAFRAEHLPKRERERHSRNPEPKKVRADRVKAARLAELKDYDRRTVELAAALKDRHMTERAGERQAKRDLAKEATAAWSQHSARYGRTESAPERTVDRFGRSRDRTAPQPPQQAGNSPAGAGREGEGQSGIPRPREAFHGAAMPPGGPFVPDRETRESHRRTEPSTDRHLNQAGGGSKNPEEGSEWTPEEIAAFEKIKAQHEAERDEYENER